MNEGQGQLDPCETSARLDGAHWITAKPIADQWTVRPGRPKDRYMGSVEVVPSGMINLTREVLPFPVRSDRWNRPYRRKNHVPWLADEAVGIRKLAIDNNLYCPLLKFLILFEQQGINDYQ